MGKAHTVKVNVPSFAPSACLPWRPAHCGQILEEGFSVVNHLPSPHRGVLQKPLPGGLWVLSPACGVVCVYEGVLQVSNKATLCLEDPALGLALGGPRGGQ